MTELDQAKVELEAFKEKVKSYLTTFTKSQASLARMAGIAPATLSGVLNGTYPGRVSDVINKVLSVIERELEKQVHRIKNIGFVVTSIAERINFALDLASWDNKMVCIIGESGLGKTCAIKKYVEDNPSSILIEADPTFSVKTLLINIARQLDITESYSRNSDILEAIVKKLKDSGRIIIIDEAEYLTDKALDITRRIHDKAGVPIALVGMPVLLTNVIGKRNKHEQIYSRINLCKVINLTREDVENILKVAFDNLRDEVIEAFFRLSRGITRVLIDLIRLTQRLMNKNNIEEPNVQVVKLASENLIQV